MYRVIRPLGSGGMGMVFLAHDESLDRSVAIKLIRPELLGPNLREQFIAEARAMAKVNHPNVAQVHAFGAHDGAPYLVMELVLGKTMERWLAESQDPPVLELALRVLDGICAGVAAIHAANTVHRDLKPGNILLDSSFCPRIVDLGLASLSSGRRQRNGEILGTPAYMAPELVFPGEEASLHRADVYSLGCIAYELLAGQLPFAARDDSEMLLMHAKYPVVPPSAVRPGLSSAFDRVILRALAKDPATRTPTADAFRRDLEAARARSLEPSLILVAEDDDDFRELLELALAKAFPGTEIECVADGRAALDAFERRRPSVGIFDLCMPGLDGFELIEILRARQSSTMPIVVLTASGGPSEWKRLSAMGADGFLVKPVNLVDVISLVRRTIQERSSMPPPAR